MHLGEILNSKDDPTFQTARGSNWSVDLDGGDDDLDQEMMDGMNLNGSESVLDRLIDLSLGKIHRLQTAPRKDEHKRVLVVSTLHRLLLQKMEALQAELALEESTAMIDDVNEFAPEVTPKQEAAIILNRILQEKIGCLGYNRTVKIWVEAPRNPGQNTTISMPQRGGRKAKQPGKDEYKMESNSAAPSEREPATL